MKSPGAWCFESECIATNLSGMIQSLEYTEFLTLSVKAIRLGYDTFRNVVKDSELIMPRDIHVKGFGETSCLHSGVHRDQKVFGYFVTLWVHSTETIMTSDLLSEIEKAIVCAYRGAISHKGNWERQFGPSFERVSVARDNNRQTLTVTVATSFGDAENYGHYSPGYYD